MLVDMHCCRDNDPRFAACLDGHAKSEALAEAAGFEAVDRQPPNSYDARQLMLAASQELDMPAILVESRPGGYQTPEAVEACANALFRVLRYAGILEAWTAPPMVDPHPAIFLRGGEGHALHATQAGYLAIRQFPARRVKAGETIAEVRSMETFAVLESLVSPIEGGIDAVAEFATWPFITPGDYASGVKPLAPPRLPL
jgi:predicted deacylase